MIHDPYGWWVREAGPPPEQPPLYERLDADVVIVGGGYLGMWTAWHLLEREPSQRIVLLERDRCGLGPSGRNGGFVTSYWNKLDAMVESFGEAAALRLADAAGRAVDAIGEWCREQEVDAWYRKAGEVELATAPSQEGSWRAPVDAAARFGHPEEYRELSREEVAAVARSPLFGGGAKERTAATVQPARLAFGLRERLLGRGVRIFERSPVVHVDDAGVATAGGAVRAGRVVLAVNHVAASLPPWRRMAATASSHIVLTGPVPDKLEAIGWTGGEALRDCRTMLHYFRTTNDGRIAFGWGGGHMAYGSRRRAVLDIDHAAARRAAAALRRFFPELRDTPIEHAWGGPIDVSPLRLPQFRQAGRVLAGFGFTGNGVGPAYLGGQILSGMALEQSDAYTSLPLVEPELPRRFPPEPLRFAGGELIRAAMVCADDDAEAQRQSAPYVRFVAALPQRLGMNLPR